MSITDVRTMWENGEITRELLATITGERVSLDEWDMYRFFLIGEYRKEYEGTNKSKLSCLESDNSDGPYFYVGSKGWMMLWEELEEKYAPEIAHIRKAKWRGYSTKNKDVYSDN